MTFLCSFRSGSNSHESSQEIDIFLDVIGGLAEHLSFPAKENWTRSYVLTLSSLVLPSSLDPLTAVRRFLVSGHDMYPECAACAALPADPSL